MFLAEKDGRGKTNTMFTLLKKISKISVWKFIKYNYLTKGIKRKKGTYILPYKNAILEMGKNAELILEGRIRFGINKLNGSKAETMVRIQKNAKWIVHGEAWLFFDTFIDVHPGAVFETGFFSMNGGSVIVVGKRIEFGQNIMIGRDVTIYDSDFHQILNENGKPSNFSKEVKIGNDVWLTNKVMVLKGVTIGDGALISAMTLIRKDVPAHALVAGIPGKVIKDSVHWSRDSICDYEAMAYKMKNVEKNMHGGMKRFPPCKKLKSSNDVFGIQHFGLQDAA